MSPEEKLASAINFLGERWVLHPSRKIPKGDYQPPVMKANVAATFARVRDRLAGQTELPLVQVAR